MRRHVLLTLGCLFLGLPAAAQTPKKEDMPKFLENLSAKEAKVRLAAVEGIAELGEIKAAYTREAVEPLLEIVQYDDEAKLREAAALALSRIDAEAAKVVPVLIDRIKNDEEDSVIVASVVSVGYYGRAAKEALPLVKEIRDRTQKELTKVRAEAAQAIKDKDMEKFREILRKSGPARQMNQAAAQAVRSIEARP